MNCMPIDAPEGARVVFAFPDYGMSGDREHLKRLGIKEGEVFTVERTDIGGFSTTLYLREFPGERFNTVNFALDAANQTEA